MWLYANVKFPIYNDLGEMVSPEDAEKIPLTFDIDVLYNPTDEDLTDGERLAGNLHVAYRENSDADYEWVGFDSAISDMIVFNGGKLPHCVA